MEDESLYTEGKIIVFKTLAIRNWSIWHFFLLFLIITDEMQKSFIWHDSFPKIKHETPRMEFKAGDLKSVDIHFKFVSLQYSWVKKLYDGCFH